MGFAIGIENTKTAENIGVLMRSAFNFGASMVFTIGKRYKKDSGDTVKSYRHIPLFHFNSWEEFKNSYQSELRIVGIELDQRAKDLKSYTHPKNAVYILGGEDCGLSDKAVSLCDEIIMINGAKYCLNVSVVGSIVLYDRISKSVAKGKE